MRTTSIHSAVSVLSVICLRLFPSWSAITRFVNKLTGEKYTVADIKLLLSVLSLVLCVCNLYLWPLALIPGILILKNQRQ